MPYENFNYEKICQSDYGDDESLNYFFVDRGKNDAFIALGILNQSRAQQALNKITVGWKFHLSIDDENQDNLASGWNIVKDVLIREKVMTSKVVKPGIHLGTELEHCGKQITVYAFHNPEKTPADWQYIFQQITQALTDAGIRPSYRSPGDYPLLGSHYVTYRYDYGSKHKAPTTQPSRRADDNYQTIQVQVEGQSPIPALPQQEIVALPQLGT